MSRFSLRADEPGAVSDRAAFEVLCPRCEVTFASETKRCIHCGGATVRSGGALFEARPDVFETSGEGSFLPDSLGETLQGTDPLSKPDRFELDDGGGDREEAKPGRSILGSMGSLLWVAMLIAFSFSSRMCGE